MFTEQEDLLIIDEINQQIIGLESHLQALDVLMGKQEAIATFNGIQGQSKIQTEVAMAIAGDVYPGDVGLEGIGDIYISIGKAIGYLINKVFDFINGIFKKLFGLSKSNDKLAKVIEERVSDIKGPDSDVLEVKDSFGFLHYMRKDGKDVVSVNDLIDYSGRYIVALALIDSIVNHTTDVLAGTVTIIKDAGKMLSEAKRSKAYKTVVDALPGVTAKVKNDLSGIKSFIRLQEKDIDGYDLPNAGVIKEKFKNFKSVDLILLLSGKRIVMVSPSDPESIEAHGLTVRPIGDDKKKGPVKLVKSNSIKDFNSSIIKATGKDISNLSKNVDDARAKIETVSEELIAIGKNIKTAKIDFQTIRFINNFKSEVDKVARESVKIMDELVKVSTAVNTDCNYYLKVMDFVSKKIADKSSVKK